MNLKPLLPWVLLLSAFHGAFWLGAATAMAASPESTAIQRLDSGVIQALIHGSIQVDVVEKAGENFVRGLVFVPSDPSTVWAVMRNCRATLEMVPQIEDCQLAESTADSAVVHHRVKVVFFLPALNYRFRASFENGNRVVFNYLDGDLRDLKGEWNIHQLPEHGGSVVSLSMRLVPGGIVPSGIVNRKLRQRLPNVLKAFVEQVSEHVSGGANEMEPAAMQPLRVSAG